MDAVTPNTDPATDPPAAPDPVALTPLLPDDPPRIGAFWLDARLTATASGVAYVGHQDGNVPVMLLMLSQGAASDAAARDRLAGAVNKMDIDTVVARGGEGQADGRLGGKFRSEDDDPTAAADDTPAAPWVALAYDGSARAASEADRLLADIDLSWLSSQGRPSGPDYQHYWIEQGRPGPWRLWPLPWPGRGDRSGWLSILASWVLMLLLMCLAVLSSILLFQNAPKEQAPPPVPTSATGSGGGSGSPSSPPPSSASPSGSASGSPSSSESPSQSPSESPSGSGSPTPTPSDTASASPTSGSPSPSAPGGPTTQSRL
jgi:hypothetical protein